MIIHKLIYPKLSIFDFLQCVDNNNENLIIY